MPWAAAAAIGGALISADASRSASNKQAGASQAAIDEQRRQYDLYRQDQQPYRQAGYSALSELSRLLGLSGDAKSAGFGSLNSPFTGADLTNDPGYQFRLKQGQDLQENSAAARGGLFSGAEGKALTEYGQNFASNEFADAWNRDRVSKSDLFNRYSGLAGTGQIATQQVGQAGQNYANQYGSNLIGGANAQAAAGLAQGNAWGNAFNQIGAMGQRGAFGNGGGNPAGYANEYGNMVGGYTDPNYDYTGGNLYGSAGDYSDPDLKTDVVRVGIREDGLGVYEFRYVWGGPKRVGLMADEVEILYPHAVSRDPVGFRKVDYSKVM